MLEVSAAKLSSSSSSLLVQGDGAALPFADETFDLVYMSFVLDLFPTEEIGVVLRETRRVLNPNRGRLVNLSLRREQGNLFTRIYEWAHNRWPKALDCRPLYGRLSAEHAGFVVSKVRHDSIWGLPVEMFVARPGS